MNEGPGHSARPARPNWKFQGIFEAEAHNMTRKRAKRAAKKAAPAHSKRPIRKGKRKVRWNEEAVIHQDTYSGESFAEFSAGKRIAETEGGKS
jgi:hypothetical protein